MATREIVLPSLHPGQRMIAEHPARFIVLITGRRWGKTRFGAVLCIATALQGGRAWWIAPTYKMTRVGWRLMQSLARQIPGVVVNKSEMLITLPGGGSVQVRSGHEPEALRGDGLDLAVLDECAFMKQEVWTESIRPALSDRKGRALFISSPYGGNWFADLYRYAVGRNDAEWAGFQFRTVDNPFIDPLEVEAARGVLTDRLFRQEYEAAILDDVPGALWTRAMLDSTRVYECPPLVRAVISIDPAVTASDESDETGLICAGVGPDGHCYIFSDISGRYSPDGWARKVDHAYTVHDLDRAIAEVNNGGDLVETTLRTVNPRISYKAVRATKGKYTRAEPVAALYEQGRVHHVGAFPALEDQLCTWVPGDKSPDRLDALVWGVTYLMLTGRPRSGRAGSSGLYDGRR